MNELGRQLEDSGGSGESIERVLDAIEFQTAVLTLNSAVEASHAAVPETGSPALTGQVRSAAQQIGEPAAESAQEAKAGPWQVDAFPSIAGPSSSTQQTAGDCGASEADSGVQVRNWQESLDRLRKSLAACGASLPIGAGGRSQADNVRSHPAFAPEPVPAPTRRRRPHASQFNPRDSFERGP